MFTHLMAMAALLAPAAPQDAPTVPTALTCADSHGKLNWFEGTYEEALAKAASENKIVFMDFWTEW